MNRIKFHVELFLFYHNRLINQEWRNQTEETIIRSQEIYHAEHAAMALAHYTNPGKGMLLLSPVLNP